MTKTVRLLHSQNVKGPELDPLIQDLERTLARLETAASEQDSASGRRTAFAGVIERLRLELWNLHMYRVSRRGPSLMKWAPASAKAFTMPHQSAGNPTLIASARDMIKVVALKPTLFTKEAGLPADFLSAFRAAVRELEKAIAAAEQNTRRLSRLTAEIDRLITHGRSTLRMLDGLLRPMMHTNRAFARLWRDAWRIPETLGAPSNKKKARKKKKAEREAGEAAMPDEP